MDKLPTEDDLTAFQATLQITWREGSVGFSTTGFLVLLYKEPEIKEKFTEFRGWPVEYRIVGKAVAQ